MTSQKTLAVWKHFRVTATEVAGSPFSETPSNDGALYVVCIPPGETDDSFRGWVGTTATRVKSDTLDLRYNFGRAVIVAATSQWPALQRAIGDVQAIEAALREMEAGLAPIESLAAADVSLAYDIRSAHRDEWHRLRRTMESLSTIRLRFARLEPSVEARGSNSVAIRRVRRQLLTALDLPHRTESFGNRLEACEDLYEGAVDRITDFNWWQKGHLLEIAIVGLLVLETGLLVGELVARVWGH